MQDPCCMVPAQLQSAELVDPESCKAQLVDDGVHLLDVVKMAGDQVAQVNIFDVGDPDRRQACCGPCEAGATPEQDAQDPVLLGVAVDQSPGHNPPGSCKTLWNHVLRGAKQDGMLHNPCNGHPRSETHTQRAEHQVTPQVLDGRKAF